MNNIVLIGRTIRDVELRFTTSGTAVANFTLAVDRDRKNAAGEKETDFIEVVVWSKLAELTAQYLKKGKLAAVRGSLQIRSYENREGQKVRVAEVVAENVRFLEKADNAAAGYTSTTPPNNYDSNHPAFSDEGKPIDISDDDLPF